MSKKIHTFPIKADIPCKFCQLLSNKTQNAAVDVPWLSNDHYAALVSIGALVPGWSLVCPIEHSLNLSRHYEKQEFWKFVTTAVDTLVKQYGQVRLFEHGAFSENSLTGCGTGHAHFHIVPLGFSLMDEGMFFAPEKQWERCLASEIHGIVGGQEYLFVADQFNGKQTEGLITLLDTGVSQFFRRVIANRLGIGEFFDYKNYPMMNIAEASSYQLQASSSEIKRMACNF